MSKVLIVGYGNIGKKLYEEYRVLSPDIYDPFKGFNTKSDYYDFAFVSVDTPSLPDGSCDLSQVKSAISETNCGIIVLRSTVFPGTTESLIKEFNKRIVFSPEFYGVTQHSDNKTIGFNFTILGGDKKDTESVAQLLQSVYNGTHKFCFTDSTTAELSKYMENTFLAAKVSLSVQFWELSKKFGVNYSELRELLLMDPRISPYHTFVYEDHPYWKSHCFDKDLQTLSKIAPLIESIIKYNENCKEKYNFKEIN